MDKTLSSGPSVTSRYVHIGPGGKGLSLIYGRDFFVRVHIAMTQLADGHSTDIGVFLKFRNKMLGGR